MTDLHKIVNGERVPLSAAEIAEVEAREVAHQAALAEIAAQKPYNDMVKARTASMADGGYGTMAEQLELLGEQGEAAYRDHIAAVKARFPKPE